MEYDTVYTKEGAIQLPEVDLTDVEPVGSELHALRGYAYVVAVKHNGAWLGWTQHPSHEVARDDEQEDAYWGAKGITVVR